MINTFSNCSINFQSIFCQETVRMAGIDHDFLSIVLRELGCFRSLSCPLAIVEYSNCPVHNASLESSPRFDCDSNGRLKSL